MNWTRASRLLILGWSFLIAIVACGQITTYRYEGPALRYLTGQSCSGIFGPSLRGEITVTQPIRYSNGPGGLLLVTSNGQITYRNPILVSATFTDGVHTVDLNNVDFSQSNAYIMLQPDQNDQGIAQWSITLRNKDGFIALSQSQALSDIAYWWPPSGAYCWYSVCTLGDACSTGPFGTWTIASGPQKPDLSITSIRPVQAVFDADLVAGKATAFEVAVKASSLPLSAVPVELTVADTNSAWSYIPITDFHSAANSYVATAMINFDPPFRPVTPGSLSIQATLPDSNESSKTITANVRATRRLVVPSMQIVPPGILSSPYSYPKEYEEHVRESNSFLQNIYPLSDTSYSGPACSRSVIGSSIPILGIWLDMQNVYAAAKVQDGTAKRGVGVVSKDYFDFHRLNCCTSTDQKIHCPVGLELKGVNGVLIQEGFWTGAAHELGHTFGLPDSYSKDRDAANCSPVSAGTSAPGYWVAGKEYVTSALDFMGSGIYHPATNLPQRWISKSSWDSLSTRLDISANDPALLVLTGLYRESGELDLGNWYAVKEGIPDIPEPGPFRVQVVDTNGSILISVPFDLVFEMYVEPFGLVPSDLAGFAFSIPFPDDASIIRIEDANGTVLARLAPLGKVLQDAAARIPDTCFAGGRTQRKSALIAKINAVNDALEMGHLTGAIQKLQNDVRKHIEEWLVTECATDTALQVSKQDLLTLTDDSLRRLHAMQQGQRR